MPRESYDVRILRSKAVASLRVGVTAFNSLDEEARTTLVLLHMQHAFEMLLKAALLAKGDKTVFDKKKGLSIGIETALKRCQQHVGIKLTEEEAGTIRVLDTLRDSEQHWHQIVDEGILYHHARAAVTLFDELLSRVWTIRLSDHVPIRVLPLSAEPPKDLDLLVDQEYERIATLLRPGKKATGEAKGRTRALLAAEAVSDPDAVNVSETDVTRVIKGIREGKDRDQVFPKLVGVASNISGEGLTVKVHFTKKDGLPVQFTQDADADVSAIREVDLEKKFYMNAYTLADRTNLTRNESLALRRHLGIDAGDNYCHVFKFGSQSHRRYSDNALRAMQEASEKVDLAKVWSAHRTVPSNQTNSAPPCDQPLCVTNV